MEISGKLEKWSQPMDVRSALLSTILLAYLERALFACMQTLLRRTWS
jgi:hypothetical protein